MESLNFKNFLSNNNRKRGEHIRYIRGMELDDSRVNTISSVIEQMKSNFRESWHTFSLREVMNKRSYRWSFFRKIIFIAIAQSPTIAIFKREIVRTIAQSLF